MVFVPGHLRVAFRTVVVKQPLKEFIVNIKERSPAGHTIRGLGERKEGPFFSPGASHDKCSLQWRLQEHHLESLTSLLLRGSILNTISMTSDRDSFLVLPIGYLNILRLSFFVPAGA